MTDEEREAWEATHLDDAREDLGEDGVRQLQNDRRDGVHSHLDTGSTSRLHLHAIASTNDSFTFRSRTPGTDAQWASLYCRTMPAGIRPRSDTLMPF
jgi:hypothetical protein